MKENLHTKYRLFGLKQGYSRELRECFLNVAPGTPVPEYQRNGALDRRVTRERQESQGTVHNLTNNSRYALAGIWNWRRYFPGRERKEGVMQTAERETQIDTYDAAGVTRWRNANTDPIEFKREAKEALEWQQITFRAMGTNNTVVVPPVVAPSEEYEFRVQFRSLNNNANMYWSSAKTEDRIAKDIRGKPTAQLQAMYGIHVTPVAPALPFAHLTEEQAKEVAKMLMVRYVRGRLETGMVSEVNIREAQLLLFRNPKYIKVLEEEHDAKKEKEEAKKKKNLVVMIEQLKAMTGKTFPENYHDTEQEFTNIAADLRHYPAGAVGFTSAFLLAEGANWPAIPIADKRNVRNAADQKKTELQNGVNYYRALGDVLQRIHGQISSIDGLEHPTAAEYMTLFPGGTLNLATLKAQLNMNTNPGLIADVLTRALTTLDEEEKSHGKDKKHEHKEAPVGARAVIEIYKKHFVDACEMSDDAAEAAAQEKFFENEPLQQEYEQLEEEIYETTGGRTTISEGIVKGAVAALDGLINGSDEDFICQLAQHENVQIPRGVGKASTTTGTKILEAGTWAGAGVAVAAGAAAATATALTLPVAVGAGVLGGLAYGAMKAWSAVVDHMPRTVTFGYIAHKFLCFDRLIGTRQLMFLWPRWGARPAWGSIAHQPRKLEVVWDAMVKAIKEGKLNAKTWYVRSQLMEVGRLLLQNKWIDMADTIAQNDLSPEDQKKFSMANKRAELRRQIHELVHNGAAFVGGVENTEVTAKANKTLKDTAERAGSWRRWMFGGGLQNWLGTRS